MSQVETFWRHAWAVSGRRELPPASETFNKNGLDRLVWSSADFLVRAHNPKVGGSNPPPRNQLNLDHEVARIWRPLAVSARSQHPCQVAFERDLQPLVVEREIRKLVQAIKDGIPALSIKNELPSLEAREAELQQRLHPPEMPQLLHPQMADVYREKVTKHWSRADACLTCPMIRTRIVASRRSSWRPSSLWGLSV